MDSGIPVEDIRNFRAMCRSAMRLAGCRRGFMDEVVQVRVAARPPLCTSPLARVPRSLVAKGHTLRRSRRVIGRSSRIQLQNAVALVPNRRPAASVN